MTIPELLIIARTIKAATQAEENTPVRVGGLFEEIINYLIGMQTGGTGTSFISGNVTSTELLDASILPSVSAVILPANYQTWGTGEFSLLVLPKNGTKVTQVAFVFGTATGIYLRHWNGSVWSAWADITGNSVKSVTAGTNIAVDNTDPANPVVSAPDAIKIIHNPIDPTVAIGDTYEGGTVGYILQVGDVGYDPLKQKGIILGSKLADQYPHQTVYPYNLLGTSEAIGSGNSNTNLIIADGNLDGNNLTAAFIVSAQAQGGQTDWYLPTKNEMLAILSNLPELTANYENIATSSEVDIDEAWAVNGQVTPKTASNTSKNTSSYIYPVRNFEITLPTDILPPVEDEIALFANANGDLKGSGVKLSDIIGDSTTLASLTDVDTTESKNTPIDADNLLIQDSEDLSIWKKLSWGKVKETLETRLELPTSATLFQVTSLTPCTIFLTGTVAQLIDLANATTIYENRCYNFINLSNKTATIRDFGAGVVIGDLQSGHQMKVTCVDNSTSAGAWLKGLEITETGIKSGYSYIESVEGLNSAFYNNAFTYKLTKSAPTLTANRTINFPDASGTVALTSDLPTQNTDASNSGTVTLAPNTAKVFTTALTNAHTMTIQCTAPTDVLSPRFVAFTFSIGASLPALTLNTSAGAFTYGKAAPTLAINSTYTYCGWWVTTTKFLVLWVKEV